MPKQKNDEGGKFTELPFHAGNVRRVSPVTADSIAEFVQMLREDAVEIDV